jgi:hypothetical protein
MWSDIYRIFMLKGMEYVRDPENRSEILRVGFMVFMRILSMVRGKKKVDENVHIECQCKSCKVWKLKVEEMERKQSQTGEAKAPRRCILPAVFSFAKNLVASTLQTS